MATAAFNAFRANASQKKNEGTAARISDWNCNDEMNQVEMTHAQTVSYTHLDVYKRQIIDL